MRKILFLAMSLLLAPLLAVQGPELAFAEGCGHQCDRRECVPYDGHRHCTQYNPGCFDGPSLCNIEQTGVRVTGYGFASHHEITTEALISNASGWARVAATAPDGCAKAAVAHAGIVRSTTRPLKTIMV